MESQTVTLQKRTKTPAEARRAGLKTIGIGLAITVLVFGAIIIAELIGLTSVPFFGLLFFVGWVAVGGGIGEVLFANRFRVLVILIAVIVGIVGIVFNFWLLSALGWDIQPN